MGDESRGKGGGSLLVAHVLPFYTSPSTEHITTLVLLYTLLFVHRLFFIYIYIILTLLSIYN